MLSMKSAAISIQILAASLCATATAAQAQQRDDERAEEPRRYRAGVGTQLVPRFPGSRDVTALPFFDLSTARGSEPFEFEAPDEGFDISLINTDSFEFGPAANIEGSRTASDVGAALDKVPTTVEAGAFANFKLSPSFRLRGEVRKGIGGHEGLISMLGADFVARDADRYLFSIGPRVSISDSRYHRAFFGVTPAEAARTGLPAFAPGGGIHAVGATAGFLTQIGGRWGLMSYAKYDRLVGDAGRSPVVRQLGSRDQLSGGLALTYTFGGTRP